MRQVLSLILTFAILTRSAESRPDTASITMQIVGMPLGANIELRLNHKQKVRGARGVVSDTGFALVDAYSGERQIAFADIVSVRPLIAKSHTGRYVLIGVVVGVVVIIVALRGLGCALSQCRAT